MLSYATWFFSMAEIRELILIQRILFGFEAILEYILHSLKKAENENSKLKEGDEEI